MRTSIRMLGLLVNERSRTPTHTRQYVLPTKATIKCQPFQDVQLPFDVSCSIYVFWVPPEEEEEPEEDVEPADGMLFVSADPEQIPEEAKPVVCSFSCLGNT